MKCLMSTRRWVLILTPEITTTILRHCFLHLSLFRENLVHISKMVAGLQPKTQKDALRKGPATATKSSSLSYLQLDGAGLPAKRSAIGRSYFVSGTYAEFSQFDSETS